jgi:hypothetical protein
VLHVRSCVASFLVGLLISHLGVQRGVGMLHWERGRVHMVDT